MAQCDLSDICGFFDEKMVAMPSTAGMIKQRYCQGDSSGCARYMVCTAVSRQRVPADLFPNHVEKAREIIMNT